jgi:hypothetical protein
MTTEFTQGVKDVAGPTSRAAVKGAAIIAGPGIALVGVVIGMAGLLVSGFFKALSTHVRKLAGKAQEFVAGSFSQAWEDFFSGMVRKSIGFPLLPYKGGIAKMHDGIVGTHSPNHAAGAAVNTSGEAAPSMQLPEDGADGEHQIIGASRGGNLDADGNPIPNPRHPNGSQVQQQPVLLQGDGRNQVGL